MTLKQAKRAYQKSGGPKFTERELRVMKRNAELFEREQKCKEKEKTKRDNKRKRQEKEEKVREKRRKMGLPEKEEGYVSPRQTRLGVYFGMGKEMDRKDDISNTTAVQHESHSKDSCAVTTVETIREEGLRFKLDSVLDEKDDDQVKEGDSKFMSTQSPSRRRQHSPIRTVVDYDDRHNDCCRNKADRLMSQLPIVSDVENKDPSQKLYSDSENIPGEAEHSGSANKGCTGWRMPLHEVAATNVIQVSRVTTTIQTQACTITSTAENDWMSFLPSNTQVERELTAPIASQIIPESQATRAQPAQLCVEAMIVMATPKAVSPVTSEPAEDVFTTIPFICTQDLEFTEDEIADLTTPTAVLNHRIVSQQSLCQKLSEGGKDTLPSSDFGEFGLSTQDFKDLLSPISKKSSGPKDLPPNPTKEVMGSFDYGDFTIATQEFFELME